MTQVKKKLKIIISGLVLMALLVIGTPWAAPMVGAQVGGEMNVSSLSPAALRNAYLLNRLQQYLFS